MKSNLIIVESPTKAKTIQGFLDKKTYHVISTQGHIMDLPDKEIGVKIYQGFKPTYVIIKNKKKIVQKLKSLINKYTRIFLASDEDREGESIAYQVYKIFDLSEDKYKRIVFHEITKNSILYAIKHPRKIDYNLVYAQQARRILDRLVGFKISPLLWKKLKMGLSAGRVQSVALRMIVERENDINHYIPFTKYQITAKFIHKNKVIKSKLNKEINSEKEIKNLIKILKTTKKFIVNNINEKTEKKYPYHPFTTVSLQQEAYNILHFSISKTMYLAQKLYEKGYITYLRTDSNKLSDFIVSQIKKFISLNFGDEYISNSSKILNSNKFTQEAHEAIRPTIIKKIDCSTLSVNENSLYKIIWRRTIMSQMKYAIFNNRTFHIEFYNSSNNYFVYTEKIKKFDGFTKISSKKILYNIINDSGLKKGSILEKKEIIAQQVYKNNVSRYSESTLVKNLEKLGIGRPSTYVPIISNIQNRNYVNIEKKLKETKICKIFTIKNNSVIKENKKITRIEKNKFVPTEIGNLVIDFLKNYFQEIVNYNFTANLEKNFDDIAKGNSSWKQVIQKFYDKFEKEIKYVQKYVKKQCNTRFLGIDVNSNKKIFARLAKFGYVIQIGEFNKQEKPKFFPLLKNQKIDTISLKEALKMIVLPKTLGEFNTKQVILKIKKYRIYIQYDDELIPITEKHFFSSSIDLNTAINIIKKHKKEI